MSVRDQDYTNSSWFGMPKEYPVDHGKLYTDKPVTPSGTKFDQGKTRVDLIDSEWLEGVGDVLAFGANKYAAHNWRGGISFSRLLGAMQRHTLAINRGEDIDPESGKSHIYHLSCGAMFLSWMMTHRPDLDDRYKKVKSESNTAVDSYSDIPYYKYTTNTKP